MSARMERLSRWIPTMCSDVRRGFIALLVMEHHTAGHLLLSLAPTASCAPSTDLSADQRFLSVDSRSSALAQQVDKTRSWFRAYDGVH